MEVAVAEKAVGIEFYATPGRRCQGRAKSTPEDFRVEEVISTEGVVAEWKPGTLPLYRVEKRFIDTMHMARELEGELKSRVSYSGLKDSAAVAVQYVTPTSTKAARPLEIVKPKFRASLVGFLPRPLSRTSALANKFTVTIRDCCPEVGDRVSEALHVAAARRVPNYFGLQRFGKFGGGTHLIGKALVKGEFDRSVRLLLEGGRPSDGGEAYEAMTAGSYEEASRLLPPGRDVEILVARELGRHPGEWVRALRAVPVRLRRFYVQAYQSFIYNKALSRALDRGEDISAPEKGDNWAEATPDGLMLSNVRGVREEPPGGAIPLIQLVGYAYRDYGSRFDRCIKETLESEGVVPAQYYVKDMQEISAEGGFRRPHLALKDASWKGDGTTVTLGFTMARGQYATVLLREVLKPSDPVETGLV